MPRCNRTVVEVEGCRLETATIAGASDRPSIVLLHEGLGSLSSWRDFPSTLAARTGCSVAAYSRYGHGASDRLSGPRDVDYMHHEALVVLPQVLARLGITRPILFGHSDGASIALIYASHHPEGAAALIVEAPHLFVEAITVSSIAAIKVTFERTDLRTKLARHHVDPESTFHGWNDIWLDPRFRAWNIEDEVAALHAPVLAIQGTNDEFGTGAQLDALRRAPGALEVLMLEHCGHAPHREQPEAVLSAVAAFISKIAA